MAVGGEGIPLQLQLQLLVRGVLLEEFTVGLVGSWVGRVGR